MKTPPELDRIRDAVLAYRPRGSEGSASVLASEASHKSVGRVQRTALRTRRKGPPRRGRVIDKLYLAWIHTQPCAVFGKICPWCSGVTAHHVRRFGESKDDRRAIPLCVKHHLHDGGPFSIERLGKKKFQERYGMDIEATISELNAKYEEEKAPCQSC